MTEKLKVLIIEDSEDDAIIVSRELKKGGYSIEFTRVDTERGLLEACSLQDWDLIVSDFSMPQFSGSDALKVVRARNLDVPFIFVSGTMGEEVAVEAMRHGAQDYLMKNNLKRLVPVVQRELKEYASNQERRRLEKHVQQLQKFEAIGRLSGGIAHDFNNVLGAIMGWAELGYEETSPGTKVRDRFQKIRDQSHRAAKLTSQLLAFGRKQLLQPRKINLNNFIEEEMSFLEKVIGENIEVKLKRDTALQITNVDPTQLQQVFMNLLLNARDAMPSGGKLSIETNNAEVDADFCRLHVHATPGTFVQLTVTDTGEGMDSSTVDRIFEPFFTTKELGRGTGLGLATVFGIVKQHHGFIIVESELGKGSSFKVYLPAESGTHEPREIETDLATQKGTETILLAEDHEGLREAVREMLQNLGYRVIVASDGQQAIEFFKKQEVRIDLIVMDMVMPGAGGLEVCQRIEQIETLPKVIFTSGYASDSAALAAYVKKGALFLQKPYNLQKLSQMIRSSLESHS